MDYEALTRRDIVVKNHVVEQLSDLDAKGQLYQVWQPSPYTWSVAMERRLEDPNPMSCVSDYLEFPADYSLVGLVDAFNITHAYACMNHLDDDMQGERVTLLAHHLRSGSPGDVIVPPGGLPHLVTTSGFQMLGRLHG